MSDPAPRRALPTQQAHPWRTVLRTGAWYVVAVLAVVSVGLPVISDTLDVYLSADVRAALAWATGLAGALLLLVQRLVLLQPVADLLARIGLGTGQDGSAVDPESGMPD